MKKILSIILILLIISLAFAGCSEPEKKTDRATIYAVTNTGSISSGMVNVYNRSRPDLDSRIEIVEFESYEALGNKLSTELMTGGGPDLILMSTLTEAGISSTKLVSNGAFMDLNELIESDKSDTKINLNDYNKNALECGVVNGKRLFIPFYYTPEIHLTSVETLSKFYKTDDTNLSYDDLIKISDSISGTETTLYEGWYNHIYDYIDSQINFYNGTYNFENNFANMIEKINAASPQNEEVSENYIFNCISISLMDIFENVAKIEQNDETPLICSSPTLNGDIYTATVADVYFVNANSKHTDTILEFLKFSLSEDEQNDEVGAEIEKYDDMYSQYSGIYFPVNNKSLNTLISNCRKLTYTDDDVKVSEKNADIIENYIKSITNFKLVDDYYNWSVISESVNSYLNGDISAEKFASQVETSTKLYLTE